MFHFASEINAYNKLQYPFQFACSFANELRKLISYTMNLFYKKYNLTLTIPILTNQMRALSTLEITELHLAKLQ